MKAIAVYVVSRCLLNGRRHKVWESIGAALGMVVTDLENSNKEIHLTHQNLHRPGSS